MTRAEAFILALPMAAIVVLCLIGWACERYIRRRPRNRYRKTPPLPPPAEGCIVRNGGPWWPRWL